MLRQRGIHKGFKTIQNVKVEEGKYFDIQILRYGDENEREENQVKKKVEQEGLEDVIEQRVDTSFEEAIKKAT